MTFLVYIKIKNDNDETLLVSAKTTELFETVNTKINVNLTKYIIYGTHLNIEGTISIPNISGIYIDKAEIVVKNIDNDEIVIDSEYTYTDSLLSFSTINELNSGLNLESLSINKYFIFLKTTFSNSEVKY